MTNTKLLGFVAIAFVASSIIAGSLAYAAPGGKSISFPNTYVVSDTFPVAASTSANAFVSCSSGDKALSGGVLTASSGMYVTATTPYPGWGPNPISWYGAVQNTNTLPDSFNVYVVCADLTP